MPLLDRKASGPEKARSSCRLRQLGTPESPWPRASANTFCRRGEFGHTIRLDPCRTFKCPAGFWSDHGGCNMTLRYAVGIKMGNRADQITVEAEDALIAALKVKTAHPEAAITYVRKRNARGDRRHPHSRQIDENRVGQTAGDAARPRSPGRTHDIIEETMPEPVPKPPGRPLLSPSSSRIHPDHRRWPEIDRSPD